MAINNQASQIRIVISHLDDFELTPVFIKVREAFEKAKQRTNAVALPGSNARLFILL
jgi:hypothetical protein